MATTIIEITVKTLDSQNHQFSVADEMTVKDFKAEISPRIGIPADQQRLIFRGRVLQDEKKLNECDVANNTVHVVIRPANASSNRNNDEPSRSNIDRGNAEGGQGGIIITGDTAGGGGRNAIIMGAIGLPSIDIQGEAGMQNSIGSRTRNSAAFRLQVGNQMLGRASSLLRRLEVDDTIAAAAAAAEVTSTEEANTGAQNQQTENNGDNSPMDIDLDLDDQNNFGRMISQVANAASAAALVAAIRQVPNGATSGNASTNSGTSGQQTAGVANATSAATATPRRPEAPRLREMASVIQDIVAFQERLSPYLQYIQSTLRSNRLYEADELQSTQYVFDTISTIIHYMGHSYHALSDIMCDFATPPETRRLRATASVLVEQSSVIRATIPIAVPTSLLSGNQHNSVPTYSNNSNTPQNTNAPAAGVSVSVGQPEVNLGSGGNMIPPVGGAPQSQINFGMAGQPQVSFGMAGQPQVNFGSPGQHQINFGGLGQPQMSFTGTAQGGFGFPDLSALLGPAMAQGIMPMFMQANASQPGRPTPTSNTATSASVPNNQAVPPATTASTGTARPQGGLNNNGLPGNAMGMNNFPHQFRGELSRPPFDILLSCQSHHGGRNQSNNRPANLHQFVNVADMSSNRVNHGSSEDFLLNCADLLRQSNLLNIVQPMFQDVINNYLMRGRDVKNSDHIRSCGKSLAKKLTPFLESFTEKVSNRDDKVVYSETYCNLIASFFADVLQSTLNNPAGSQYKVEVLRSFDKFVEELMAVFKVCFARSEGYLPLFVKALVDKLLGGTSLIFRENAAKNLTEYLSSFILIANSSIDPRIVYKDENKVPVLQSQHPATVAAVPVGNSPGTIESSRVAGVLPPKQARQTPGPSSCTNSAMDEDIDDMLNLTAPRRPRTQISTDSNRNFETALRNIPSEWVNTVSHDLHRQLGMPDQPPFSPGYIALLSRKP